MQSGAEKIITKDTRRQNCEVCSNESSGILVSLKNTDMSKNVLSF